MKIAIKSLLKDLNHDILKTLNNLNLNFIK